jgi:hypothetical protein
MIWRKRLSLFHAFLVAGNQQRRARFKVTRFDLLLGVINISPKGNKSISPSHSDI